MSAKIGNQYNAKPAAERVTCRAMVNMTAAEKVQVDAAAALAGVRFSSWARSALLLAAKREKAAASRRAVALEKMREAAAS